METLLRSFANDCGWLSEVYTDNKVPKPNEASSWRRLMVDIAANKFDAVVMQFEPQGLRAYCERFETRFEVVNPPLPRVSMAKVNTGRVDTRRRW